MRRAIAAVGALGLAMAAAAGLWLLKPALPSFERSAVILDTVQRGALVTQVWGSGTLAPVDVTWVTAEVGGQVLEVLVEPGIQVAPDTELLKLRDPQLERAVREAQRDVESAQAELEQFELQRRSLQFDLKLSIDVARANFEEAREDAEIDETMVRRGLKSPRQFRYSKAKSDRNRKTLEVQIERAANSVKSQDIQYREREESVARAADRLQERQEQLSALRIYAGTYGVLQQFGLSGDKLEAGQRIAQGAVVAKISNPLELKAVLLVSQVQARDVVAGQPATIDTRSGFVAGRVIRVAPGVQNDRVAVEVELIGELPKGARPDLNVEGSIEVSHLDDVLHVRKPVYSQENGRLEVFRLDPDGETATRTTIEFGKGSRRSLEVVAGLKQGDQIVVSDTTRWKTLDRVRLQ